jgi:hypothetical protein
MKRFVLAVENAKMYVLKKPFKLKGLYLDKIGLSFFEKYNLLKLKENLISLPHNVNWLIFFLTKKYSFAN